MGLARGQGMSNIAPKSVENREVSLVRPLVGERRDRRERCVYITTTINDEPLRFALVAFRRRKNHYPTEA